MYNVMIVDDEEPVLDSFEHMLRSGDHQFQLCGKARSGQEAVAMAAVSHPDLIFMDIGMPGISGLDAIAAIQRQYPEMLFVISTAYERFDIAKQAIPLGVVSYLVKPISKRTFFETLEKSQQLLEERSRSIQSQVDQLKHAAEVKQWEQKSFLSALTLRKLREQDWEQFRRMLSLSGESAEICFLYLAEQRETIYEKLISRLSYKYQVLSAAYLGSLLIFIPCAEHTGRIEHRIRHIIEHQCEYRGSYSLGCSFAECYQHYYNAFREAYGQNLVSGPAVLQKHLSPAFERLRSSIRMMEDWQSISVVLNEVSSLLLSAATFEESKMRLISLVTLLLDDLQRTCPAELSLLSSYDHVQEIMSIEDTRGWETWISQTVRFISERSREYRMQNRPVPLRKALSWIDREYARAVQLSDVAEACGISPAYLSRLFSEHMHTSFVDYLTSVRLKHAQLLLDEGSLSVKQIAVSVGYQDPNYFSKIFKKVHGMSPTGYQRKEG